MGQPTFLIFKNAKGNGGLPQHCNQEAAVREHYLETHHWPSPSSLDHGAPLQDSYSGSRSRDTSQGVRSKESSSFVTQSMDRLSIGTNGMFNKRFL